MKYWTRGQSLISFPLRLTKEVIMFAIKFGRGGHLLISFENSHKNTNNFFFALMGYVMIPSIIELLMALSYIKL